MNEMLFLIMLGAFAGDHFKVLMEAGEIIETALEAELFDADAIVNEQFTCMSYPDFSQELGICLSCSGFKIPAEGIRDQTSNCSYLFEVYLLAEMGKGIVINGVDPVVF